MTVHYRTQGIVLKHTDRGEADRIFTVFTKDFGKLDVWGVSARHIRSKLRGSMEKLAHAEIEFVQGKAKKTLTDARTYFSCASTRKNLKKLNAAFLIAETFRALVRGEERDEALWKLLKGAMARLESLQDETQCSFLYFSFFWRLVSTLGFRPSFASCARCASAFREKAFVSVRDGIALCETCAKPAQDRNLLTAEPSVLGVVSALAERPYSDALEILEYAKLRAVSLREISAEYFRALISHYE